ncbi:MAG: hypothetical protein KIS96_10585 [Bauldia sp.]|nr:hypothetical protein [Bauldia sp.]
MKRATAAALAAGVVAAALVGSAQAGPATNGWSWAGAFGVGITNGETRYYADQTFVIPAGSLAVQIDTNLFYGSGALGYDLSGLLFARDPSRGHLGLLATYVGYRVGNPNMDRVGVGFDGAYYWDRWTFQAMAGVEFDGFQHGGGVPEGIGFNVAAAAHYYLGENWRVWAGIGHVGGANMLVIGTEFDPGAVLAGTTRIIARATISNEGSAFWIGGRWMLGGEHRATLLYDDRHEYAMPLHGGHLGFAPTTFRY